MKTKGFDVRDEMGKYGAQQIHQVVRASMSEAERAKRAEARKLVLAYHIWLKRTGCGLEVKPMPQARAEAEMRMHLDAERRCEESWWFMPSEAIERAERALENRARWLGAADKANACVLGWRIPSADYPASAPASQIVLAWGVIREEAAKSHRLAKLRVDAWREGWDAAGNVGFNTLALRGALVICRRHGGTMRFRRLVRLAFSRAKKRGSLFDVLARIGQDGPCGWESFAGLSDDAMLRGIASLAYSGRGDVEASPRTWSEVGRLPRWVQGLAVETAKRAACERLGIDVSTHGVRFRARDVDWAAVNRRIGALNRAPLRARSSIAEGTAIQSGEWGYPLAAQAARALLAVGIKPHEVVEKLVFFGDLPDWRRFAEAARVTRAELNDALVSLPEDMGCERMGIGLQIHIGRRRLAALPAAVVDRLSQAGASGTVAGAVTREPLVGAWLIARLGAEPDALINERKVPVPARLQADMGGQREITTRFIHHVDEIRPADLVNGLSTTCKRAMEEAEARMAGEFYIKSASDHRILAPRPKWFKEDADGACLLNTKAGLAREGKEMGHCVGTYADAVERQRCHIIALQLPAGERATLELFEDGAKLRIAQLRGPRNADVSEDMKLFVYGLIFTLESAI